MNRSFTKYRTILRRLFQLFSKKKKKEICNNLAKVILNTWDTFNKLLRILALLRRKGG